MTSRATLALLVALGTSPSLLAQESSPDPVVEAGLNNFGCGFNGCGRASGHQFDAHVP